MTIDDIIKLGKEADYSIHVDFFNHPTWVWLAIGVGVVLFILTLVFELKNMELAKEGFEILAGMAMVVGMFGLIFTIEVDVNDEVSKWKEDVAIPYIDSLPVEEKEVVFIKIDPELSSNVRGGLFYTYSSDVEKTPITVSFKDNGKVVTRTSWVETDMELSDSEKPYVEFQRLEKELGHGLDAGIYNMRIHLPENYSFTDIK